MATVANLTVKDDGFEGTLATLNVAADLNPSEPEKQAQRTRLSHRQQNGFKLGAGWKRKSQSTGAEYISVSLSAPEFGTIYGNIANAPGNDPDKRVIIWNPPA